MAARDLFAQVIKVALEKEDGIISDVQIYHLGDRKILN